MAIRTGCLELDFTDPSFDDLFIKRAVFDELAEEIVEAEERCLVLEGDGGSGKSTFVSWLVRELLRKAGEGGAFPVLVRITGPGPELLTGLAPLGAREERAELEARRLLDRDLLAWLLEEAQASLLRSMRVLDERRLRRARSIWAKISKALNFKKLKKLASMAVKALEITKDGLEALEPAASSLGLVTIAGVATPVAPFMPAIAFLLSLREFFKKEKPKTLFDALEEKFSKFAEELFGRAEEKLGQKPKEILLIVDDLADIMRPEARSLLLASLWVLAHKIKVRGRPVLKVLVVRRRFKAPPSSGELIGLKTPGEEEIMGLWYRRLDFPSLSDEELWFVVEMASKLGYTLRPGRELDVAKALWVRCLGNPRTICMALACVRAAKGGAESPIGLEDLKLVPRTVREIHQRWAWHLAGRVHSLLGPVVYEAMKVASCMTDFTEEELINALRAYSSGTIMRGQVKEAVRAFLSSELVRAEGSVDQAIYDFSPAHRALKAFLMYEILDREDRADIHASIVEALYREVEKPPYVEEPIWVRWDIKALKHAFSYLSEGGRERGVLAKGLRAGLRLSKWLMSSGFPSRCYKVSLLTAVLARAMGDANAYLLLLERMARSAYSLGIEDVFLLDLASTAKETALRAGTERAIYLFCCVASSVAMNVYDARALDILSDAEGLASKMLDGARRADALSLLNQARASLLAKLGRTDEAEEAFREAIRWLEELKTMMPALAKSPTYLARLASLESTMASLLLSSGDEEALPEALKHYERAHDLYGASGRAEGIVRSGLNMALVRFIMAKSPGELEELSAVVERCSRLAKRIGSWVMLVRLEFLRALTLLRLRRDGEALEHAARALRTAFEKGLGSFDIAIAFTVVAHVILATGRAPSAEQLGATEALRPLASLPPSQMALSLANRAMRILDEQGLLNAWASYVVVSEARALIGQMDLEAFLGALKEAEEAFGKAGARLRADALRRAAQEVAEEKALTDALMREIIPRVLLAI